MTKVFDPADFSGFYRLSLDERIDRLSEAGLLGPSGALTLKHQGYVLSSELADQMIENVVGVFGLPLGLVTQVRVNQRDYLVPMVVEEPSIVAAASAAARLACKTGGFDAELKSSLLVGQIELRNIPNVESAVQKIQSQRDTWLERANAVHPKLVARGGGARDIEVIVGATPGQLVVHLLVDTCDAMGANLINTQCEALAPALAESVGGVAGLKILSNLVDRSVVKARMRIATTDLKTKELTGAEVAAALVAANELALSNVHRAATHNKGIMNGIDPIAIATGNDWRAIEAGAHAFAARDGTYRALTDWRVDGDKLIGEIEIPIKVGTVGASLQVNPGTQFARRILGIERASELAELMAAVGLGQNFAALRALSTAGIQAGHMRLHARSVVQSAGVAEEYRAGVTARLLRSGEIKEWKAREILTELQAESQRAHAQRSMAAGKIILGGEHAVVYGHRAIALPLPNALGVSVRVLEDSDDVVLNVPAWRLSKSLDVERTDGVDAMVACVLDGVGVTKAKLQIDVSTEYPSGVGLGSSASFAVGLTRALAAHLDKPMSDSAVNAVAFESERVAHGNPSGLDNTLATYGEAVEFRRGPPPAVTPIAIGGPFKLLIMLTRNTQATAEMVAKVARLHDAQPSHTESIFALIDALCADMTTALAAADWRSLGELMNINHGLLNALGVSVDETEALVDLARRHGALGAKMTGGGGGGAVIALPADAKAIARLAKACEARKIPHYPIAFEAT